jgi:hypothetical protein
MRAFIEEDNIILVCFVIGGSGGLFCFYSTED